MTDRYKLFDIIDRYRVERGVSWPEAFRVVSGCDLFLNHRRIWRTFKAFKSWKEREYRGTAGLNQPQETPLIEDGGGYSDGALLTRENLDALGFHTLDTTSLERDMIDAREGARDREVARQLNGTPAGARITAKSGTAEGEAEILRFLRTGSVDGKERKRKTGDVAKDRGTENTGT